MDSGGQTDICSSVCLSVCLSVSVCLSASLSVYLSVCLSVCQHVAKLMKIVVFPLRYWVLGAAGTATNFVGLVLNFVSAIVLLRLRPRSSSILILVVMTFTGLYHRITKSYDIDCFFSIGNEKIA